MCCNVSPALVNLDQSLSAMRFAESVKKVENKAVVNRAPHLLELAKAMEENAKLRRRVAVLEGYVGDLEDGWAKEPEMIGSTLRSLKIEAA